MGSSDLVSYPGVLPLRGPGAGPGKLRVCLVEDSALIRARLSESLIELPNLEIVAQAESEAAALDILRGATWDVAVLDLQLRPGTGLNVLKSLAQGSRPSNTRIIVFTNYTLPQYRERSLSLGADFFFEKGREFARVREVICRLAGGGAMPH